MAMRIIAISLLLFAAAAQAGESPAFAKPGAPQAQEIWFSCRVTVARPGRPLGSLDVIVYTAIFQHKAADTVDYNATFGEHVTQTYGLQGNHSGLCSGARSEADAQQNLDYWTTNKNNPSQIQVVKTGWTP